MITAAFSPGDYPAAAARQAITAGLAGTSSAASIAPRAGVIPDGVNPFLVSASTGMTVSVKAGQAVVAGWVFTSDTSTTVTLATAGSTARTDLVILRIQDSESGDAVSTATVEAVTGTSAAAPALPSTRCFVIAQIAVGANVSALTSGNITDKRVYTAAAGGIIPAPGALASAPTVPEGTAVYDASADRFGIAAAGSWKLFASVDHIPQPVRYDANPNGGVISAVGDAYGITDGAVIAAKPYPQMVVCDFSALVSTGGNPGDVLQVALRVAGTDVRAVRGNNQASLSGGYSFLLPANTSAGVQLIASKIGGSTATGFTGNGSLTYLSATAFPAGLA